MIDDKVKHVIERYNESFLHLAPFFEKAREAHRMYVGKQWLPGDEKNARLKRMATPNINVIKKNVDTIVGIQKMNKTALSVKAEEVNDNMKSGIANIVLHHQVKNANGYQALDMAFKSAVIAGLGWVSPYIDFSVDPENGQFMCENDSIFDMFYDPHFRQKSGSDMKYVVRRKVVDKLFAIQNYPDFADEIENSNEDYKIDQYVTSVAGLKDKVLVMELWEKDYEKFYTVFFNDKVFDFKKNEYEQAKQQIEELKATGAQINLVERKKQVVKLTIVLNNKILVYHGDSPYGNNAIPFVPMFGFFDPEYESWDYKLQGLVEQLKDIQREKNRWRANMMYAMNTMIHSGWIMDKGAVDDTRILQRGMSAPIIEKNPGKQIDRIRPMDFPQAFAGIEALNDQDFLKIGLNPDILGNMSRSDSGKAIKLRMTQGLTSFAELTDGYNEAMRNFGILSLGMIFQNYTKKKILRIIGNEYAEVTEDDILDLSDIPYDIDIDETTYNPTHKMQVFDQLVEMMQYGVQNVSPKMLLKYIEIDPAIYNEFMQDMAQQEQMQAQQAQQANELQNRMQEVQINNEMKKGQNMQAQSALMSAKVMENLKKQNEENLIGNYVGDME